MKELSIKEFNEAPHIIQYITIMAHLKQPLGSRIIEKAVFEYPQYFPEELEHRKKWENVPDEVKESYFKEISELFREYFNNGERKGIVYWATHPDEYKNHEEEDKKLLETLERKEKEIEVKYLSKYGLK